MEKNETQNSINKWCNEHYPDESLNQRFYNLLEETIELGVCLGINKEKLLEQAKIAHDKSMDDFNQVEKAGGEIADVYISICYLADMLNKDIQKETNLKMAKNRQRTIKESKQRNLKKQNLGLRSED